MTTVVLGAAVACLGLVLFQLLFNGSTERKPPTAPDGRQGFDIWPYF